MESEVPKVIVDLVNQSIEWNEWVLNMNDTKEAYKHMKGKRNATTLRIKKAYIKFKEDIESDFQFIRSSSNGANFTDAEIYFYLSAKKAFPKLSGMGVIEL